MKQIYDYQQEKERELEELKRTNPEMALEAMEKLEKTRIAERATLKHRNSSKYLQMQSRQVELFHVMIKFGDISWPSHSHASLDPPAEPPVARQPFRLSIAGA